MLPPLTTSFVARIRALKAILDEVYEKSLDEWVQGFELDGNPERELFLWECMALTYRTYTEGRDLSIEAKHQVLQVTLWCSLGMTEVQMLKKTRKALHKVEVLALADCYRAAVEAMVAVNQGQNMK